ncbi:hypothetical protein QQF64_027869 [Cirrhinus molitorella]|uniref:Uncharacterized protein n=1 Tax=Cirrhinus molitorella TaxID=172907 RepID=A0ABR3NDM5_9TELE
MRGPAGHWMSCGHPCAEHAVWNPKFCVVTDYQMLLLDKEEVLYMLTQKEHFLMFPTCPYTFRYTLCSYRRRGLTPANPDCCVAPSVFLWRHSFRNSNVISQ